MSFDFFNSRDEIDLVFADTESMLSFYCIQYTGLSRQGVKMQKQKMFENTNTLVPNCFLRF